MNNPIANNLHSWQINEKPYVGLEIIQPPNSLRFKSTTQKDNIILLKNALMDELIKWIKENHFRQEDAAAILQITRPRVSYVMTKKMNKFSIDSLVNMLTRTGKNLHFEFR